MSHRKKVQHLEVDTNCETSVENKISLDENNIIYETITHNYQTIYSPILHLFTFQTPT